MMKLYYSSGSCSTSCHIGLEEAGLTYEAVQVDFAKSDAKLAEVERLNPLKVVPVLVTEQGKTVTQNIAILEHIADQKPASQLLAPVGSYERVQTMQWLSFIAADLHKAFAPLFGLDSVFSSESTRNDVRKWAKENVRDLLAYVDRNLEGKDYLLGKTFTAADCYLFVVVGWAKYVDIKTDEFKNLNAYMGRVYQRPAVQKVLKMEGLLQ